MIEAPRHIIDVEQLREPELQAHLLERAAEFQAMAPADYPKPLQHRQVATLFYEPSTRTRLSFDTAAKRLGAGVPSTENAGEFSSAAKGETIEDTIMTIQGYVDAIVLRHKDDDSSERAAAVAGVPIINAGSGKAEHPTQALLDLFTIKQEMGQVEGLKIGMAGDLAHGRTVHSLVKLLRDFDGVQIIGVAPDCLAMPEEYRQPEDVYVDRLDEVIGEVDVLYMTRTQLERIDDEAVVAEFSKQADNFKLTNRRANRMKPTARILHPLPRVGEITKKVDKNPRARYFQQAHNGLFVRMALLEWVLEDAA
jgi:aspartate carbamoyltransferase catalytic subunit